MTTREQINAAAMRLLEALENHPNKQRDVLLLQQAVIDLDNKLRELGVVATVKP